MDEPVRFGIFAGDKLLTHSPYEEEMQELCEHMDAQGNDFVFVMRKVTKYEMDERFPNASP